MSTGFGVGGLALAPLVGSYLIPSFGWRAAYLALAILTWVLIIPLALLVIKTKPAVMGLYPDGMESPEAVGLSQASPSDSSGLTLKMALVTSAFWVIAISFLLHLFSQMGIIQSQVPYLEDIGFPIATAATALGTVALMSAIGKFGFGWLCDRIPPKYACSIGLGLQLMAIIILINVETDSPLALIWLYTVIMGLGVGSWLPTISMLVSTHFGLTAYGAIFGVVSLVGYTGVAIGPLMAAYMYDTMNTYHWAFITFLVLYVIALLVILVLRRPRHPTRLLRQATPGRTDI
jgi:MFS family permease